MLYLTKGGGENRYSIIKNIMAGRLVDFLGWIENEIITFRYKKTKNKRKKQTNKLKYNKARQGVCGCVIS